MYPTLVTLHSLLRWLVVGAALLATLYALYGIVAKAAWSSLGNQVGALFTWAVRINLLLGFVLWAWRFASVGFNVFYHVIHPLIMFAALALAEVLAVRRHRSSSDAGRWPLLLLGTLIPFVLILLAIPRSAWPF